MAIDKRTFSSRGVFGLVALIVGIALGVNSFLSTLDYLRASQHHEITKKIATRAISLERQVARAVIAVEEAVKSLLGSSESVFTQGHCQDLSDLAPKGYVGELGYIVMDGTSGAQVCSSKSKEFVPFQISEQWLADTLVHSNFWSEPEWSGNEGGSWSVRYTSKLVGDREDSKRYVFADVALEELQEVLNDGLRNGSDGGLQERIQGRAFLLSRGLQLVVHPELSPREKGSRSLFYNKRFRDELQKIPQAVAAVLLRSCHFEEQDGDVAAYDSVFVRHEVTSFLPSPCKYDSRGRRTNRLTWTFFQPLGFGLDIKGPEDKEIADRVASTEWTLGLVVSPEFSNLEIESRERMIRAATWWTLLLLLALILVGVWRRYGWWYFPVATTLLFAISIGTIWYATAIYQVPFRLNDTNTDYSTQTRRTAIDNDLAIAMRKTITDLPALKDFKDSYTRHSKSYLSDQHRQPVFVKTGIYLRSAEFESSRNIHVTGLVWQHACPDAPAAPSCPLGVRFPEEQSPAEFNRIYPCDETVGVSTGCLSDSDGNLVVWEFSATLRQDFDYSKFPLDQQEIWISLRSSDFDGNVVLVPDLDEYVATNPTALAGVERRLILPGWKKLSSGFYFLPHTVDTSFGLGPKHSAVGNGFPELHFSLHIQRLLIDPAVSQFIPILVAAMMVFAMLMITTNKKPEAKLLGFSAKDIILGAAALFFVVVFQHAELRESYVSPKIMYVEIYYFGLYASLFLVSLNAIAFATGVRWSKAQNNLFVKAAFWPVYFGLMWVATLWYYYYAA